MSDADAPLAARARALGESATLAVSRRAAELRDAGVEVADFGVGEPDFPSPERAVTAARKALAEGLTRYTAAAGLPALRDRLVAGYRERWDAPWTRAECVVTVGAKAALLELALACFEAGSEAVVSAPYWVSIPEQIRLAGGAVRVVATQPEDGFSIRAEPLLDAIGERTKAVYVNSPCNPTGGIIPPAELERLVVGCAERGVLLVADETYDRFVYDGRAHVSAASFAARHPDAVVVVGSFSKTWAMTGWRLGYLCGPRPLVDAVIAIQGHATSNPTSFAMAGALAVLEGGEEEFAAHLAEFQARRDLVLDRLEEMPGIRCARPAGAFYVFPDVSQHYTDDLQGSAEFAAWLLEEAAVATVPGVAFGADEHIRLSYACSRRQLEGGLERMEAALRARSR